MDKTLKLRRGLMPRIVKGLLFLLLVGLVLSFPGSAYGLVCGDTSGALDTMYIECTGTADTLVMLLKLKSDNSAVSEIQAFGWPVLITVSNNALVLLDTTVATTFGGTAVEDWTIPLADTGPGGNDPAQSPVHFLIGYANLSANPNITGDVLLANIKLTLTGDTTTITIDTLSSQVLNPLIITELTCEYVPYWTADTCAGTDVKDIRKSGTASLPTSYSLGQNYPNPFNASTVIQFALPKTSAVKLEVFNVLGQKVVTLVDEELQAGYKQIVWDGKDQKGNPVATGIYFYRIRAEDLFSDMKKMLFIK